MRLRYDFNALAELETKTGKSITQIFSQENIGFNVIRMLVWAGSLHTDRNMTLEQAGSIIQGELDKGKTLQSIIGAVTAALKESGVLASDMNEGGTEEKN